jgi:hypothetical protein
LLDGAQATDNAGAFDGSMQHHLGTDLFKGGVYDQREMVVETFSRSEKQRLESLEGWADAA